MNDDEKRLPQGGKASAGSYWAALAAKYHIAKYAVIVVLAVMILFTAIFGSGELKTENFRYFFKYFQVNPFSYASSYSDISFTGNPDMKFSMYKGDLVSLCDGKLTVYSLSGKTLLSADALGADTVESDGKYLALYKRGGNTATLYNSFSAVHTINSDYPINDIDVSSDGGFALATSEKNVRSSVLVYSKAFSLVYTWKSTDKYVSSVRLSENGTNIGIFASGTEGGIPYCELIVKNTGNDMMVVSEKYRGETPYYIFFSSDGGIISVTDRAARFYSRSGEKRGEELFSRTITDARFEAGKLVIAGGEVGFSGTNVTVISEDGRNKDTFSTDEKICSICADEDRVYLLGYGKLYIKGGDESELEIESGAINMFSVGKNDIVLCYTYGTRLADVGAEKEGIK